MSIARGLVGWWRMDGRLVDESGNGNDGTGTPEYEAGKFGQSYRGRDDNSITTPIAGNAAPGSNLLTMATWVRDRDSISTNRRFFGFNVNNRQGAFVISLGGDIRFVIGTSSSSQVFDVGNIGTDVWTHLAMTRTGTALGSAYTFFINGVPVLSENSTSAAGNTGAFLAFGGIQSGVDVGMSGVFLYTRALAAHEIRQLYALGSPIGIV